MCCGRENARGGDAEVNAARGSFGRALLTMRRFAQIASSFRFRAHLGYALFPQMAITNVIPPALAAGGLHVLMGPDHISAIMVSLPSR